MLKRVNEMMLESRCRRDMMPLSVKIRALAVSPRAQLVTHVLFPTTSFFNKGKCYEGTKVRR